MGSLVRQSDVITYVAAFVAALGTALIATPVARRLAVKYHILDHPNERKAHTDPVPYLGGLGIIAAFVAAMGLGVLVRDAGGSYDKVAVILGGSAVLAVMGLWDDLRVVPGWVKAGVEVSLALGLYAAGVRAHVFRNELDLIVTVLWVVGITNALNFLDNMDGITAGVSAIAAAYFALLAGLTGLFLLGALAAALAGCALGFLWYNRPPARIFMGDAGSLFLGFLLAAIGLELHFSSLRRMTFFVPIAILGVPIFDTVMISASRLLRGRAPHRPGLDHTSHRILRMGLQRRAVVALHYLAALACGSLGVVIAYAEPKTANLLMGWLVAAGACLVVLLVRVSSAE